MPNCCKLEHAYGLSILCPQLSNFEQEEPFIRTNNNVLYPQNRLYGTNRWLANLVILLDAYNSAVRMNQGV